MAARPVRCGLGSTIDADSFLGMMYGTVLSPLLILAGYNAKTVVPAILISQAAGGFVASWRDSQAIRQQEVLPSADRACATVRRGVRDDGSRLIWGRG